MKIHATMSHEMAAFNFFFAKLHKRRRTLSGNWNPLKNHEKYFLFHLNKLNILLANQILHMLCIFIKLNVWYSWSFKILAIKNDFRSILQKFYRAAILWWVEQKTSNFLQTFLLTATFKILYCRVYCYFCVLAIKLI